MLIRDRFLSKLANHVKTRHIYANTNSDIFTPLISNHTWLPNLANKLKIFISNFNSNTQSVCTATNTLPDLWCKVQSPLTSSIEENQKKLILMLYRNVIAQNQNDHFSFVILHYGIRDIHWSMWQIMFIDDKVSNNQMHQYIWQRHNCKTRFSTFWKNVKEVFKGLFNFYHPYIHHVCSIIAHNIKGWAEFSMSRIMHINACKILVLIKHNGKKLLKTS
jgi:hypothetical protein